MKSTPDMKSNTRRESATHAFATTDSSGFESSPIPFFMPPRAPMVCLHGMSNAQFAKAINASSCTRGSSDARQLESARSPSFMRISVRHSESKAEIASANDALCRTLSLGVRSVSGRAASISISLLTPSRRRKSLRLPSCSIAYASARAVFSWTATLSEAMPFSMRTFIPCRLYSWSFASTCWRSVESASAVLSTTTSSSLAMRSRREGIPPRVLMARRTGESSAWHAHEKAALPATSSSSDLSNSTIGFSPPSSTVLRRHFSSPLRSAMHFSPLRIRRISLPSATASPAHRARIMRHTACTSTSAPHHASLVRSLMRTGRPPPSPSAPRRSVMTLGSSPSPPSLAN
mmetsp:Transcript_7700/g.18649  ORF Transcript_7700/g.18649 Transcript_7700/m.18649 type:complete len:347 (-) Transcript_7700:157-1197(-)